MVKKLFKHELCAYLRTIVPMHLLLAGIALLSRFVQLFENDSTAYDIVFWSSVVVFIVGCVVCSILTLVYGIRRFYANLFTSEGYLSFTLPVTQNQHIFVKNAVAVIAQLFSILMIVLSVCVISLGDMCVEIFKVVGFIIKELHKVYDYHATLFIIEAIITFIVAMSATYFIFYACIALGQRAKKNRVAAAVGVFFAYYMICQIISTIVIILVSVFYDQWNLELIIEYLTDHPILTNHLILCGTFVIDMFWGVLCYFITKSTITKKLNLE